mgnify:CR=1 FL=1
MTESLAADLSGAALAKSLPFTDTSMKMDALSVNSHHNGQKFTDKSLENAGLSVKCVLLTDKLSKKALCP